MNKILQRLLLLVSFFVSCSTANARVSVPTLWKSAPQTYTNETQLRELASRYSHDSKKSYYLILQAYNHGHIKALTRSYYYLHTAAPTDPYIQAALAFSHYMARDYNFDRWPQRDEKLETYTGAVEFGRVNSVRRLPNNSAVLLMAARPRFFKNAYRLAEAIPDMSQGIAWAKKAVQMDKKWAEPYFWVGEMLQFYAGNNVKVSGQRGSSLNRQAIPYFTRCLQLGKGNVEQACWYGLASSYHSLKPPQLKTTLIYLDRYIASLTPQERKRSTLINWRRELISQIEEAKKA